MRTWRFVVVAVLTLIVAGCSSTDAEPVTELSGWVRDPLPEVGELALPDVGAGNELAFVAPSDGLLLVYFGFTACPDMCPLTLSDVRQALDQLGGDAERIDLAVVTVDPDRDTDDVLTRYVRSFVDDAHALRTDDPERLRHVADAFGADYVIERDANGAVEVGHTAHLYAVDDQGRILVTWPFGTEPDRLEAELRLLLHEGIPTT